MPLLAGCSELSQTEGLSWRDVNSEKNGVGKRVFTGNTCGSLAWDTGTWQSVNLRDGTSRQPDSTSPQCVPAPAPCIIRLAIENRTRSNTVFDMVANSELLLCFAYQVLVALSRPNVTSCGTGLTVTSGSNSHTRLKGAFSQDYSVRRRILCRHTLLVSCSLTRRESRGLLWTQRDDESLE